MGSPRPLKGSGAASQAMHTQNGKPGLCLTMEYSWNLPHVPAEIICAERVTPKVDCYSFGILLHEICTGALWAGRMWGWWQPSGLLQPGMGVS